MKKNGILLNISSLSGDYNIGSFGKEAKEFANFLAESGVNIWQVLPMSPTSFGDSPYQSTCVFAGNPYYIDLPTLVEKDLLKKEDLPKKHIGKVDYKLLYNERYKTLYKAYEYSYENIKSEIAAFKKENKWLKDFSLFMAVKDENKGNEWTKWEDGLKFREKAEIEKAEERLQTRINFYDYLQYLFFSEWRELKEYINSLGIEIYGDMPIYSAYDSMEVWANREFFELNEKGERINVAGVPPDYFSKTGQLWGNPLYNIDNIKKANYSLIIDKMKAAFSLYDVVRLDHFIGYQKYYSIPATENTAINGKWKKGFGKELFDEIKVKLPNAKFVAENLGQLTEDVETLRKDCGFFGMKVLQFEINKDSLILPPQEKAEVFYTGTHDNDTLLGFLQKLGKEEEYEKILSSALSTDAEICIVPIQDYLRLNNENKMNTPGTCENNWQWRLSKSALTTELKNYIRQHIISK